jgi:glycosyltransferase involved in cell wall biosynthesis
MTDFTDNDRRSLLFVGAFPPPEKKIFGGNVTACRTLLDAGLAEHLELILLDSTQRSVPPPSLLRRLFDSLPRIWKFIRLLLTYQPDATLVFASTGPSFFEKSLLAALTRLTKSRVLFFPRGGRLMDESRRSIWYYRYVSFMMRFPNIILCQEKAWHSFFVNEIGVSPERCFIIPNWTATPALLQIGLQRKYEQKKKIRILFLGWVYESKGVFELVEAFAQLLGRFPEIELLIAGEGKDSDLLHAEVTRRGLTQAISFLGWIEGDDKASALSMADIFALPSHVEGLPNAMIEAMAAGLPIIVTPVGSIPNVIQDGENGLLTPVQDPVALAQCIEMLLVDSSLREQIGRGAYQTAVSSFGANRAVKQLVALVAGTKA